MHVCSRRETNSSPMQDSVFGTSLYFLADPHVALMGGGGMCFCYFMRNILPTVHAVG